MDASNSGSSKQVLAHKQDQSSSPAEAIHISTAAILAASSLSVSASATEAARSPSQSQPSNTIIDESFKHDNISPSAAAATVSQSLSRPRVTPCSLNPSTWSKKRIRITACGCFSSIIVCIIRLLLDPGPSAYIIHSIIILFDLLLIHIFTYTLWLSIAGELTAIIFATAFHTTHETIFELIETTLIAVLVSFHMIKSRNYHWGREENLERDMIGLQFYIEHHHHEGSSVGHVTASANHESRENLRRRSSSLTKSEHDAATATANKNNMQCDHGPQNGDVETGAFVPPSDMTNISSFTTIRPPTSITGRIGDSATNFMAKKKGITRGGITALVTF